VSGSEYLLGIYREAAEKDAAFSQYLYEMVTERMASGRGMDCDEYRALLRIAGK
jgi:hypothetical protein